MAEWSKATDSSSVLSGGVGSNPTGCKQYIYNYTQLTEWSSGKIAKIESVYFALRRFESWIAVIILTLFGAQPLD